MIATPMDVLTVFPVRKSKRQKAAFRAAAGKYAASLGYPVQEERGSFGCRTLIIGDPEQAEYLITAHYDTCARLPFPNFLTPCSLWLFLLYQLVVGMGILLAAVAAAVGVGLLTGSFPLGYLAWYLSLCGLILLAVIGPGNPHNANDNTSGVVTVLEIARSFPEKHRDKVCFVLFDLEEAGLIGSGCYRKKHDSATRRQLIFNLDCVGDGDYLMMFPTGKLRKDKSRLSPLYPVCGRFGKKSLQIKDKGFRIYPSDQMNFPYALGICALRKGRCGLYISRIHTARDTILEITNVNLLRSALTSFICCGAAQIRKDGMQHETL